MKSNGRAKAGYSENSFWKHKDLGRVAKSLTYKYVYTHPRRRLLFIDTNAGDGEGVIMPQMPLPEIGEDEFSCSSPRLLAELCRDIENAHLIVCEKRAGYREALARHIGAIVPTVEILENNIKLLNVSYWAYDHVVMICDPCGPSTKGEGYPLEVLDYIASHISCDFIFTVNKGALDRILPVGEEPKDTDTVQVEGLRRSVREYRWMPYLPNWPIRLKRKWVARSRRVEQSKGFRYQLLVAANSLPDHISKNRHKWETYKAGDRYVELSEQRLYACR